MCGITGFWGHAGAFSPEAAAGVVRRMADQLAHRGPDDAGTWVDPASGIALGHRRLSIVDLSPTGHQPMVSASGRLVIAFNGEIYNHRALRCELDGASFRGTSDTEVLLVAIERWGLDEALRRAVGMFAFALVDVAARSLTLVRDRMGEKPLYYGRLGGALVFGSELDALRAYPGASPTVSRAALAQLLTVGYVPAPRSIYEDVAKLEPGHLIRYLAADDAPRAQPYWTLADAARRGLAAPFQGDSRAAAVALEGRLRATLREQMQADVPVGAFLSGGIDSSALVALVQREATRAVRTFTIGFDDPRFDEADHARAVSRHLGTDHTEMRVGASDALELVPRVPEIFDEPVADYSQLPTFLVAKLTREHVKVSVSADGGDELFGGYHTYRWIGRLSRMRSRVPPSVLRQVARLAPSAVRWLDGLGRHAAAGRAEKAIPLLGADSAETAFRRLTRHWPSPPVVGAPEGSDADPRPHPPPGLSALGAMRAIDATTYLPGDVLAKVDRTTMTVGLEARAPLLDHRIVEFAWSLPDSCLVADGKGKWPLRHILYRCVPRELVDRPKMGFSPPMGPWLRGALRPWADALLSASRLRREGYLDPDQVGVVWREHVEGRRDHKYLLWDVLSFQAWLELKGS